MSPQQFFTQYAPYAMSTQIKDGVPASITLAQAALESSWGESGLTKAANNFFGIKDFPNDDWHGENYVAHTTEWNGSTYQATDAPFRKYSSPQQGFDDHAYFLRKNSRYGKLFALPVTDYTDWAAGLHDAGYATDPAYAGKLINLINTYHLEGYTDSASVKKK